MAMQQNDGDFMKNKFLMIIFGVTLIGMIGCSDDSSSGSSSSPVRDTSISVDLSGEEYKYQKDSGFTLFVGVDNPSFYTLSYQWYKEETTEPEMTAKKLEGQTKSTFIPKENGNYYVVVTAEKENSSSLTLTSKTAKVTLTDESKPAKNDDDYLFLMYDCGQNRPLKDPVTTQDENGNDVTITDTADEADSSVRVRIRNNTFRDACKALKTIMPQNKSADGYGTITIATLYADCNNVFLNELREKNYVPFQQDWLIDKKKADANKSASAPIKMSNMGNGELLENFLKWAKASYDYKNVVLIISCADSGPYNEKNIASRAVCETNGYETNAQGEALTTYLSDADIKNALTNSGFTGDKKPCIIFEDCGFQSAVETVYDLKGTADYFLSSASSYSSIDYLEFLKLFKKNANIKNICKEIIDNYATSQNDATLTLVHLGDTAKLDVIKTSINAFASEINTVFSGADDASKAVTEKIKALAQNDESFSYTGSYAKMKDVAVFAKNVKSVEGASNSLKASADNVIQSIKDAVSYSRAKKTDEAGVIAFDRQFSDTDVFGLTITFSYNDTNENANYKNYSEFGENNAWGDVVGKF